MLHYHTVNDLLQNTLTTLMHAAVFNPFRLVGGTASNLHLGHRVSVDIDLFSDASYGSLNFDAIEQYLNATFPYVDYLANIAPAMGKSFTLGNDIDHAIQDYKKDIRYWFSES
ncbi:nucleotidyl transferase AbiEii/AbiGii toxin family protein [Sphingobacterium alkalisoli]|uniref:Nucleotidyl transferase AbiEii/AbiGii toxin family protein n=1 Tax=Sphingobacterium alkalisoli TaxID=1874115 RepID=A0A4U0H1T3_9SPHI|nr:nucleotidyl transferase AbiEii/AbiGii toxin family protein [Sphingobacterium alkalisoli]TJY65416.1 nucleotidyl transferase AbiEii/AbiGii toxin family protein [Sphingobacterium alkalisoli]GGH20592.1 hypothetical protein GCM10011418_25940 [Sphingobacterium alkalisoli]